MDALATIKRRLHRPEDADDADIRDCLEEVALRIRHYCNIPEVPEALMPTLVRMTLELLRADAGPLDEMASLVTTIKLGDTTVEEKPMADRGLLLDRLTRNYAHDLHAYRRLRS